MTDDGQGQDERRVAEIRARHAADSKPWGQECRETGALYPCDTVYLLGRLDALKAERDDALARLAAAEAALADVYGVTLDWIWRGAREGQG